MYFVVEIDFNSGESQYFAYADFESAQESYVDTEYKIGKGEALESGQTEVPVEVELYRVEANTEQGAKDTIKRGEGLLIEDSNPMHTDSVEV
ncbi:MAG: hypothetical protein EP297_00825 [Gammaproteobacteria bacterium]|nr:MAG: hypothetical protein EP297_00825 [Gammaproteobacteria bacterium]